MRHKLARSVRGETLKAKAMRGAAWTLAGFGANKVLGLVSTLVLTRLLFPEAFGLMALAGVFMTGLQMFSDIGIRPSIIQSKRGEDPDFLNTAWTMQVIRGFVLWAIACAIAYPVSLAYSEPSLFPILCVLGSTAAIRGFQTTGYATANRKLALGKLTTVELATHAIGLVVTVVWAWLHPTVWALVGGAVVSSVLSVSMGFGVLSTHRHRLRWDRTAASELVRFGKWIFVSTAITFLANSGDKLILPKTLSFTDLGFYTIALGLIMIPVSIFKQMASRVLFAAYTDLYQQDAHKKINRLTAKFTTLSAPIYAVPILLIFYSDFLISTMYEERYSQAGKALSVLAISGYLSMMRASQNGLLLAVGNSKRAMLAGLSRIAVGLPASVLMARAYGLEGFCAGIVIAEAVAVLTQRYMARLCVPGLSSKPDQILMMILLCAVGLQAFI
jgi:O-antigen/teichoic acid export membrane protein